MKESHAQNRKIPSVWQAVFSQGKKMGRLVPVSAPVEGRRGLGRDAGKAESEPNAGTVSGPKNKTSHCRFPQKCRLGCSPSAQVAGSRHAQIERYLCLVLIAHLLLTHQAVSRLDAQALVDTKTLPLPSLPQLQEQFRSDLWTDILSSLESGTRHKATAKKIKQLIQL